MGVHVHTKWGTHRKAPGLQDLVYVFLCSKSQAFPKLYTTTPWSHIAQICISTLLHVVMYRLVWFLFAWALFEQLSLTLSHTCTCTCMTE